MLFLFDYKKHCLNRLYYSLEIKDSQQYKKAYSFWSGFSFQHQGDLKWLHIVINKDQICSPFSSNLATFRYLLCFSTSKRVLRTLFSQVRLGQVRLDQVRLGQAKLGQVRLGQVYNVFGNAFVLLTLVKISRGRKIRLNPSFKFFECSKDFVYSTAIYKILF